MSTTDRKTDHQTGNHSDRVSHPHNSRQRKALQERRRMRRRRRNIQIAIRMGVVVLAALLIIFIGVKVAKLVAAKTGITVFKEKQEITKIVETAPDYDVQLLSINDYSRPGLAIDRVDGIVVHYTATPGTSAQQNRDYFEGLKDSHETSASSHFVIGIEGEIIQCIPCNEISYASNDRNNDTLSIECCIPDDTGKFSDATYDTLVHTVAWLCGRYGLTTDDVIRHYDVTGKMCPKYYVEHEDAWDTFKEDVNQYIDTYGVVDEDAKQEE